MVKRITSDSLFEAKLGYARAIIDGDMVHVSGTTGFDCVKQEMPEDPATQARNAFETISKALNDAGASLSDTVRVRYYFTDVAFVDPCAPVLAEYLGDARPAATLVIAQLIDPKMKVEIELTARIGAHTS